MTYIKKKSQKQEKRVAEQMGGKVQLASGALFFAKADVRTGKAEAGKLNANDFLIENKFTDADKYPLKLAIWDKIAMEAVRDNGRMPLLQVDITGFGQYGILNNLDFEALELGDQFKVVTKTVVTKNKSLTLKGKELAEIFNTVNNAYCVEFEATNQHLVILDMNELLYYIA